MFPHTFICKDEDRVDRGLCMVRVRILSFRCHSRKEERMQERNANESLKWWTMKYHLDEKQSKKRGGLKNSGGSIWGSNNCWDRFATGESKQIPGGNLNGWRIYFLEAEEETNSPLEILLLKEIQRVRGHISESRKMTLKVFVQREGDLPLSSFFCGLLFCLLHKYLLRLSRLQS